MENKAKVGLAVGVAAVGAGIVWLLSKKAVPPPPPPPPPGLANLYGKVTDANTGNPITDALVALDGMQTYTDSSGNYAFTEIQPGEYVLQFSKEGYETAIY